jgi:hypothetical protein
MDSACRLNTCPDTVTIDFARLTNPRSTLMTCAGAVALELPNLAMIVLLPAMVPVKVTVYVLFLLPFAELKVPFVLLVPPTFNATASPPLVYRLSWGSSACNVMMKLLPDWTESDDTITNDFDTFVGTGVTVMTCAVATQGHDLAYAILDGYDNEIQVDVTTPGGDPQMNSVSHKWLSPSLSNTQRVVGRHEWYLRSASFRASSRTQFDSASI